MSSPASSEYISLTRSLRPWMLCTVNPVDAFGAAICSPEPSAVYGDGTPLLLLACMLLLMCHKPQALASHRDITLRVLLPSSEAPIRLGECVISSFDATKACKAGLCRGPCKP
jgi:hypothetical protein